MVGHGAFLTRQGVAVEPTLATINRTQAFMISLLESEGRSEQQIGDAGADHIDDSVLRNWLHLDRLLASRESPDAPRFAQVNDALREHYLSNLVQEDSSAERLFGESALTPFLDTTNSGEAYIEECRMEGVPVPDFVFGEGGWTNRGELNFSFLFDGSPPAVNEIWSWESTDPPGVCLALPRWDPVADKAKLVGLICLGTTSSKACFFNNKRNTLVPRYQTIAMTAFSGGLDLYTHSVGGVCTDCHMGENPFVVHPEQVPFLNLEADGVQLTAADWYDPIVASFWPQNPGPIELAPGVDQQECSFCHQRGRIGGRFPDMTTSSVGYCGVLAEAADTDVMTYGDVTMPPSYRPGNYADQTNEVLDRCDVAPTAGVVADLPGPADRVNVLSPPTVLPLYACSQSLAVSGAGLNRTIKLYWDDGSGYNLVATRVVRNPDYEEFVFDAIGLPAEAQVGDQWYAVQADGAVNSAPSQVVEARNHLLDYPLVDYPAGLPVPIVQPAITHVCASRIGVTHVPGAELTVWRNGDNPVKTRGSARDRTIVAADDQFDLTDVITVTQSLCGYEASSAPPVVLPIPGDWRELVVEPENLYEGQQLLALGSIVEGAFIEIGSSIDGPFGSVSSWPINWLNSFDMWTGLGRGLQIDEKLELTQGLCDPASIAFSNPTLPCSEIPAPEIQIPRAGQTWVIVSESVPGARVRMFTISDGMEIGDGGGRLINLTRPLVAGEAVQVMQSLNGCEPPRHFAVDVQ